MRNIFQCSWVNDYHIKQGGESGDTMENYLQLIISTALFALQWYNQGTTCDLKCMCLVQHSHWINKVLFYYLWMQKHKSLRSTAAVRQRSHIVCSTYTIKYTCSVDWQQGTYVIRTWPQITKMLICMWLLLSYSLCYYYKSYIIPAGNTSPKRTGFFCCHRQL